jgi:hypothetical protein
LTASVIALGLGCAVWAQAPQGYGGPDTISWRTYKAGQQSRVIAGKQVLLLTGAQWQAYWQELTGEPAATAPSDVDWVKEQLVAVNMGRVPTAGYEVYVRSMRQAQPGHVVVTYVEVSPAPGQLRRNASESPWVIVRMPRLTAVITFAKQTETAPFGFIGSSSPCSCCYRCTCGRPVVIGYEPFKFDPGSPWPDPLQTINWRTFESGSQSKIEQYETRVLETEGDFQMYWSRNTGNPPHTAPRTVDWNKERLVAINLGTKQSGGYSVAVESVKRVRSSEIEISFAVRSPTKGTPVTQGITSPYTVIRMDRVAGTFTFKKRDIVVKLPDPPKCECGCRSCRGRG